MSKQYLYRVKNPATGKYIGQTGSEPIPGTTGFAVDKNEAIEYPIRDAKRKARQWDREGFTEIERGSEIVKVDKVTQLRKALESCIDWMENQASDEAQRMEHALDCHEAGDCVLCQAKKVLAETDPYAVTI